MPVETRGVYARTNNDEGFKANSPDAWVVENGPVWWYGSDSAYLTAGQRAGHSAITKATNVIVGTLTSGEWTTDSGETPSWLSDPMRARPDERGDARPVQLSDARAFRRLPAPYLWGQYVRSALLDGMGYLVFQPTRDGAPRAGSVSVIPTSYVTPADSWGSPPMVRLAGGDVAVDDEGGFSWGGRRYQLLELRNPTTPLDPITGTTAGVLAYHAAEFALLSSMTDYAAGTFTGAGVPSGFLKVDSPQLSQEQADALKKAWQTAHASGRRSTAVLNAQTTYEAIGVSPVDAALAEMTKAMLVVVANAFSVPYALLAAPTGDSLTYSTLQMNLQSLEFALQPWVRGVESTLSVLLPAGQDVRLKLNTRMAQSSQPHPSQTAQPQPDPTSAEQGGDEA